MTNSLKNKRVTVMGLGLHGGALGTISWLVKQGAKVTVTDMKSEEQLASSLKQLGKLKNINFVLGQHRTENFTNTDLVIRNPAVPKNSPHLQAARKAGVAIEMDSSLFFLYSPTTDIIGVTGSKGKTTASHAIAHILGATRVGTDGVSPLGEVAKLKENSTVVFELSSWRLEALTSHKISPPVAVVTSIYREHLNTYTDLPEYIAAKKGIIRYQKAEDTAILNYDDAELRTWESEVQGTLYWFSLKELPSGKEGIYRQDGQAVVRIKDKEISIPLHTLALQADHEQRNVLPAILIACQRGVSSEKITAALTSLPRLSHRLEIIRELNGVTYINDSASTMPDATIAALQSLAGKSLVLILGGSDKKLEFKELGTAVDAADVRAIVWLPGSATARMKSETQKEVPQTGAETMTEAVTQAATIAQSGDTVLLSPGATSFGLFKHEFDRGDQFRQTVSTL
ncbi:MAG: UDP-N-acetylmuramoyl-L-alanine--D-glutamate ligase [Candidatus Andersenbacteria bacterium]|nr:UDP-N-acetylmuramoyl-L-alanine--D-glutamate ligase [Candidatus Andersenbacteria bacterium]MBI3250306.1 UDP-N-acetylmuramoyl-L-alanine--D-glutamate ligase [Candidatus Andersenbacteria bacterium]